MVCTGRACCPTVSPTRECWCILTACGRRGADTLALGSGLRTTALRRNFAASSATPVRASNCATSSGTSRDTHSRWTERTYEPSKARSAARWPSTSPSSSWKSSPTSNMSIWTPVPQCSASCRCHSCTQQHRTQTARNIELLAGASSIGTRWRSVSFSHSGDGRTVSTRHSRGASHARWYTVANHHHDSTLLLCRSLNELGVTSARACPRQSFVVVCCCFPVRPFYPYNCCVHSSRISPVPSLALRMGSSDQCDGNQCCLSFGGCLCRHRQEWSLRLDLTQHGKTHQVLTYC